jgi:hypothetical protein
VQLSIIVLGTVVVANDFPGSSSTFRNLENDFAFTAGKSEAGRVSLAAQSSNSACPMWVAVTALICAVNLVEKPALKAEKV